MTTIAYHHDTRTIAYDGRISRGDTIITDTATKMTTKGGVRFFISGAIADDALFIDLYFGAKSDVVPDAIAFVVDAGTVYRVGFETDGTLWKYPVQHNDAIGSGWVWAIAAMDFGQNARVAVSYAASRDIYTGGSITEEVLM